jgi:peptidoglycan/xylan/chitin deacetylase (PgdA/CDA1 family)
VQLELIAARAAGTFEAPALELTFSCGISLHKSGRTKSADEERSRTMRRRLGAGLERTGMLSAALRLRKHTPSPWLPVITYHRFASAEHAVGGAGTSSVLDDDVADATAETFDRQISLLARWFTVLDLDDVLALPPGKLFPPNPVLVTFDDGYKDGLEVALPILRRHGVKATFFVATDYVDQRKLFWWDRIHMIVKSSAKESMDLTYPSHLRFHLRTDRERMSAAARLTRLVKDEWELDLDRFIDELSEACGASVGLAEERRMAEALLMTWDDLRALRDGGMSVQSHTRSHRTLQTVPLRRLRDELGGSRTPWASASEARRIFARRSWQRAISWGSPTTPA